MSEQSRKTYQATVELKAYSFHEASDELRNDGYEITSLREVSDE